MDPVASHIAALLTGDRRARDHAAKALSGRRFDVARLAPLLAHAHVSRQIKAIEVMRAVRDPAAIPLLVPLLASPAPLVAEKVSSALQRIGPAAADAVAASLPGETPAHHLWILDALSRLRDPRGARPLVALASQATAPGWRRAAIKRLRRYRGPTAVAAVLAALQDPDRDVRSAACDVAGAVRDPASLAPLIAVWLDQADAPIQALFAIGKYGPEAMDPLLARAGAAEGALRDRIADALRWCLSSPQGRAQVGRILARPEPAARDAALQLFGQGYARLLPAAPRQATLAAHERDPDPRRRLWCVAGYRMLSEDARPVAEAALARLANDADSLVRLHAAVALKSLGSRR